MEKQVKEIIFDYESGLINAFQVLDMLDDLYLRCNRVSITERREIKIASANLLNMVLNRM